MREEREGAPEQRQDPAHGVVGRCAIDTGGAGRLDPRFLADCSRPELDEPVRHPLRPVLLLASLGRSRRSLAMVLANSAPLWQGVCRFCVKGWPFWPTNH